MEILHGGQILMKKRLAKGLLFLIPASLIILIDQLTKAWAVQRLMGQADITIIPEVLELTYVENTGMAFGLLKDGTIFFYIATFLALALIVHELVRVPFEKRFVPFILMLSFVSGGAIGNLIDRIVRKYVVDFIYVSLIRFPVFNVADIFVTLTCIALIVLFLFIYKEEDLKMITPFRKKKQKNDE